MKLRVKDVHFSYKKDTEVLRGIDLTASSGELLTILAPNGNGKTTLLKCMGHLMSPTSGRVYLDGQDIAAMSAKARARSIAYVPQSFQSLFSIRVIDLVLSGRSPFSGFSFSRKDREIAIEAMVSLGLEDLAFRDVRELSGGEQQRVLLARALAQTPKVLLLDEPTASLDVKHQLQILDNMTVLKTEKNLVIIMSTHDLNLTAAYADQVALIKDGCLLKSAAATDALTAQNIFDVFGVHAEIVSRAGQLFVHLLK